MSTTVPTTEPAFAVVSPQPARAIEDTPLAPRLETLEGKTVAFIWDYIFRGNEMWEHLKVALSSRYAGLKFVEADEFGSIHGEDEIAQAVLENLAEKLKAKGVDAVVAGVGC